MVSNDDLEGLSLELGTSWDALARRLEFKRAERQEFDHAYKQLRDKSYYMLCRWKEKSGSGLSGATYKVLYKALCHKYVACKGLAEKFCIRESPDESKKRKDCTSEWLKVRQILLSSSESKRATSLARETPLKVSGTLILLWLEHRRTNFLFSPTLSLYSSYLWEVILRADKPCLYYRRRRTFPREKENKKWKKKRWLSWVVRWAECHWRH